MNKILVVTIGSTTEKSLYNQLQSTIGSFVDVQSIRGNEFKNNEEYELLVFSSPDSFKYVQSRTQVTVPYIIAERVVNHKKLIKLVALPKESRVLVVNDSAETAREAINQLKILGIDHLRFTPYYPGIEMQDFSKYDVAITLGEPQLVPNSFSTCIDLGTRIIAIKSIHEIVEKIGLANQFNQRLTEQYIKDIVDVMKTIEESRKELIKSETLLESIINNVEQGIVCMDQDCVINRVNEKMETILGRHSKDILGRTINQVLGISDIEELLKESRILEINEHRYLCVTSEVNDDNEKRYVITFENINRLRNKDIKLKQYYLNQKHVHMHTFVDYMTKNQANLVMLEKAKRFALTESNILVQGENGTGKEILAQAIHRHSKRREKPFLPINITAISDNLLESELFGYEPGAFTGADKNGKVGIFEKAEGGTVFIDEIGDAPLSFQARLLRVIQEKRIRRVGGHEEIPIDVRIVSATNKDLLKMVEDKSFREDLYFRLNVLPLKTIPLRERREDIVYLLDVFLRAFKEKFDLTLDEIFEAEVLERLKSHNWRGNVRELLNFTEFIGAIYSSTPIKLLELPEYLQAEITKESIIKIDYLEYRVLGLLSLDRYTGRRKITEELTNQNVEVTEGQVRGIYSKLESKGLLDLFERKGARMTLRGAEIQRYYSKNNIWS